eukprot:Hpha_TRINITY_DN28701_c0_g1::TRINITY_DN28701_c0_g1_i1::g.42413::m.42413
MAHPHQHSHGECSCLAHAQPLQQTISEMDWLRGIWGAAHSGDIPRVERLLSSTADSAREADQHGYYPLHYASSRGLVRVVVLLLNAGADPSAATPGGRTALHKAAFNGHTEVVRTLLASGALLNARDSDGLFPVHAAADRGHQEVVQLLEHTGPAAAAPRVRPDPPMLSPPSLLELAVGQLPSGTRKELGKRGYVEFGGERPEEKRTPQAGKEEAARPSSSALLRGRGSVLGLRPRRPPQQ